MKRVLLIIWAVASSFLSVLTFSGSPAYAAPDCGSFLTFRPWYYGITKDDCSLKTVSDKETGDDVVSIRTFIWTIILNVLGILFQLAGYTAVGFLIYGGYLYILARGAPEGLVKAKKTITNAIIGLIIAILATAIVNTIVGLMS